MSRWTSNFAAHAFNSEWERVKHAVEAINSDDPEVIAHADEFARLKKVLTYIDKAMQGIDPELLPLNFWDGIRDQMKACADQLNNFSSSKGLAHLQAANQHLDVILSQVRPHMLAKGRLGPALQSAAKAYASAIEEASDALSKKATKALADIGSSERRASELLREVDKNITEINQKHDDLLVDTEDQESTLTELHKEIDEIRSFYRRLAVGTGENPSIREEVSVAREVATKGKEAIDSLRAGATATLKELTDFEVRILGSAKEDGKREGGLRDEIEARLKNLISVEEQQKKRYATISEKIESLLPGATSAGLASAYNQMKASFEKPIRNANRVFYLSIAGLILLSLLVNVESIEFWSITFAHLDNWQSVARSVAHKLPFYVPLVWLAYFSSKRRSEFQRLEQEYAHKEALAKSYDSYRQQIQGLGDGSDELMRDLLTKAVDAIAFNASSSLDGRHGDKIPLQEAIEQAIGAGTKVMAEKNKYS